jgi:CheY-like chemotaxis protein
VSAPAGERDAAHERPVAATALEPAPPAPAAGERQGLVLVADADVEAGKGIASALSQAGLEPVLVHDGVEAILTIQRTLPRAVVLDAGLPKMFGFQICELMKRNESLRSIQVVLVGAIHHRDRYRRAPTEIYGADAYLERHQLEQSLLSTLAGFGLPVAPPRTAARPARAPAPAPAPLPPASRPAAPAPRARPEPAPQAAAPADAGLEAEIGRAERLARIIVSDVVLYNEEKLDAAIRAGNVLAAFESEMQEGRGHFAQRIDARVREQRDFLSEELLRVARARGMR